MGSETVHTLRWDTGQGEVFPVSVREIRGGADGPTLVLIGGEHGIEVSGPAGIEMACRDLLDRRFAGTVLAVPAIAPCNMRARQHYHGVAEQDLAFTVNTWPVWPGRPDGDPAQRLAHLVYSEVISRGDVVFNFHAWQRHSAGCLFTSDKVPGMAELAVGFGMPFYSLDTNWGYSTLHELLLSQGRRAALVEVQGQWMVQPDMADRVRQGIHNLLICLGMAEGSLVLPRPRFRIGGEVTVKSPAEGFFVPTKQVEQLVRKGELLGWLLDLDTGKRTDVLSPADGAVWLCGRMGGGADVSLPAQHAYATPGDLLALVKLLIPAP